MVGYRGLNLKVVPTENHDVSVVILTKNSARTLERCIVSAIKEGPGEILAIDGLSTDGTGDILDRYRVATLLDSSDSLGHLRQRGVRTAKGRFVMFLDSDVELALGCIARLRSDLEKHGWAGIQAMILSGENLTYWQRAEDEKNMLLFNQPGPKLVIGTVAALFRKDVLLAHPFDPNMTESCEDVDLDLRLRKSGYTVGVSNAVAYHYHRGEFSRFVRQRYRYGLGDARFGLKHRSIRMLLFPLQSALVSVITSILTCRLRLVPYWLAGGIVDFVGVFVGVCRIRSSSLRTKS
jgi:glycosyltransferase involved in cell wall biosynthesis